MENASQTVAAAKGPATLQSHSALYLNHYDEFVEKSQTLIKEASDKKHFIIIYADITDFQTVNTFYGFAEGDRFLSAFADFLNSTLNTCLCGRVFSDHFICLAQMHSTAGTETTATSYQLKLQRFLQEQLPCHPDCRLHIACGLCTVDDTGLVAAIDNANTARKRAKSHRGTKVIWFDSNLKKQIELEKSTAHLAQAALREKRYCFYLQPKVNLHTGKIVGAEALARGISADGELVYPDMFIPFLEQNGSIIEMDYLIFSKVCAYLADRLRQGLPVVTISVNLSRLHTQRSNTADILHAVASTYDIPPYLLEFELTETLLLDEFDSVKHLIDALRNYGYKVSIDDFGSGYAGINIWQELNFDILKLDKKFLSSDPKVKPRNDALIPNLIRIADQLQMTVLCEGAETEEQCEYLKGMGCSIVQGYYFSKPLSCENFDKLMEENHGTYPVEADQHPYTASTSNFLVRSVTDSIFDVVPGGMAGFDEDSGRLLYASDGVKKLTGYSIEELFTFSSVRDWLEHFIAPTDFSIIINEQQKLHKDGKMHLLFDLHRADGTVVKLEMYAGRVKSPEWGSYILCCFLNKTKNV